MTFTMRAILFDMNALVYGPTGADLLADILQSEGVATSAEQVSAAMNHLPAELSGLRSAMRTEEQENDYNRALMPALLEALGTPNVTDALLMRLVEAVHEYHAFYSMYPETLPVLQELKNRGYRLGVVANWEPSLHRFVREFELESFFRTVVPAAEVGLRKPDPYIFHQALRQVGVEAREAMHVGPFLREDVNGATQAGVLPVWLNRTGITTGHDVLTVTDLRGVLLLVPAEAGEEACN
jgi:HAD superfamily hydrolase (TIGR01549 family)